MKIFAILAIVLVDVTASFNAKQLINKEWDLFKAEHKKTYNNKTEDNRRMNIFLTNKMKVVLHNLRFREGKETYEMEINEFSDWLSSEFFEHNGFNKNLRRRLYAGENVKFPKFEGKIYVPTGRDVSGYVNWVERGAVTPVKDQGKCGSCYAFSATGALESQYSIVNNKTIDLSEQNILDCSKRYGNQGCGGGSATAAYDYIKNNGGLDTEDSYSYKGRVGSCMFNKKNIGALVTGYVKIEDDETKLKDAVANVGPISVCIEVVRSFYHYKGGIYSDSTCRNNIRSLNHVVLVVGYGTDPNTKQDYWLVKNSWGTSWGENGYIRMLRNANNMCGIVSWAIYPEVPKVKYQKTKRTCRTHRSYPYLTTKDFAASEDIQFSPI